MRAALLARKQRSYSLPLPVPDPKTPLNISWVCILPTSGHSLPSSPSSGNYSKLPAHRTPGLQPIFPKYFHTMPLPNFRTWGSLSKSKRISLFLGKKHSIIEGSMSLVYSKRRKKYEKANGAKRKQCVFLEQELPVLFLPLLKLYQNKVTRKQKN